MVSLGKNNFSRELAGSRRLDCADWRLFWSARRDRLTFADYRDAAQMTLERIGRSALAWVLAVTPWLLFGCLWLGFEAGRNAKGGGHEDQSQEYSLRVLDLSRQTGYAPERVYQTLLRMKDGD